MIEIDHCLQNVTVEKRLVAAADHQHAQIKILNTEKQDLDNFLFFQNSRCEVNMWRHRSSAINSSLRFHNSETVKTFFKYVPSMCTWKTADVVFYRCPETGTVIRKWKQVLLRNFHFFGAKLAIFPKIVIFNFRKCHRLPFLVTLRSEWTLSCLWNGGRWMRWKLSYCKGRNRRPKQL